MSPGYRDYGAEAAAIVPVDGSNPGSESPWITITQAEAQDWANWSRDGKYIYYDVGLGDQAGFYRVRISDHKVERIVSLKDIRRTGFPYLWAGLAPDDSPLLLRDTGTQEIYALDADLP